jgi:D-cysteine desulfhydrase/L-cysteate sulfo-lyase
MLTDNYPRAELAHTPTPLECLGNLSDALEGPRIWIKRDDCTGLAMGGNKARQLEFYIGDALSKGADTLLTTGAIQSNHVRMTVAAARKLGLEVEVQLEKRVSGRQPQYYDSGNPMLMKLMGAKIHYYPVGEDEEGADKALHERAAQLKEAGAKPYVIPLSGNHVPYGSLGYVKCDEETGLQLQQRSLSISEVILASGSATTHSGMLAGLKALNNPMTVQGFCVRRDQHAQKQRVLNKTAQVAKMIGHNELITDADVKVDDQMLHPGYGQLNDQLKEAISLMAKHEGILLDPTYTGKAMAGLIQYIRDGRYDKQQNVLFLHTGGTPALFGYPEILEASSE